MITYQEVSTTPLKINVKLEGKIVGTIIHYRPKDHDMRYVYRSKSGATSEPFRTLPECKKSIED